MCFFLEISQNWSFLCSKTLELNMFVLPFLGIPASPGAGQIEVGRNDSLDFHGSFKNGCNSKREFRPVDLNDTCNIITSILLLLLEVQPVFSDVSYQASLDEFQLLQWCCHKSLAQTINLMDVKLTGRAFPLQKVQTMPCVFLEYGGWWNISKLFINIYIFIFTFIHIRDDDSQCICIRWCLQAGFKRTDFLKRSCLTSADWSVPVRWKSTTAALRVAQLSTVRRPDIALGALALGYSAPWPLILIYIWWRMLYTHSKHAFCSTAILWTKSVLWGTGTVACLNATFAMGLLRDLSPRPSFSGPTSCFILWPNFGWREYFRKKRCFVLVAWHIWQIEGRNFGW